MTTELKGLCLPLSNCAFHTTSFFGFSRLDLLSCSLAWTFGYCAWKVFSQFRQSWILQRSLVFPIEFLLLVLIVSNLRIVHLSRGLRFYWAKYNLMFSSRSFVYSETQKLYCGLWKKVFCSVNAGQTKSAIICIFQVFSLFYLAFLHLSSYQSTCDRNSFLSDFGWMVRLFFFEYRDFVGGWKLAWKFLVFWLPELFLSCLELETFFAIFDYHLGISPEEFRF